MKGGMKEEIETNYFCAMKSYFVIMKFCGDLNVTSCELLRL